MLNEFRFGLSYALGRVGYDRFTLPRDWRDGTFAEIAPYLPDELRPLCAMLMVTHLAGFGASAGGTSSTTSFLTTTSAGNQTYNVPASFVSNTSVTVVSAGGDGHFSAGLGSVAGSGGYAIKASVAMTPSGTKTFAVRAHGADVGAANACWFGGANLAASVVGIECGGNATEGVNGTGADATGGQGDTVTAGNAPSSSAGVDPPSAGVTAMASSGVSPPAGFGGGYDSVPTAYPGGQGVIRIISLQ